MNYLLLSKLVFSTDWYITRNVAAYISSATHPCVDGIPPPLFFFVDKALLLWKGYHVRWLLDCRGNVYKVHLTLVNKLLTVVCYHVHSFVPPYAQRYKSWLLLEEILRHSRINCERWWQVLVRQLSRQSPAVGSYTLVRILSCHHLLRLETNSRMKKASLLGAAGFTLTSIL